MKTFFVLAQNQRSTVYPDLGYTFVIFKKCIDAKKNKELKPC